MAKEAVYVQKGENVDFTAAADIANGEIIPLVTRVGVALEDIKNGDTGSVTVAGVFEVAAVTGTAFNVGDALYWDNTANKATKTATDNTPMGWAVEGKQSAGTTARVRIG